MCVFARAWTNHNIILCVSLLTDPIITFKISQDRNRYRVEGRRRRYLRQYQDKFDSHYSSRRQSESSDSDMEIDDCPICLLRPRSPMLTLNCGHKGCAPCLDYYFVQIQENDRQCPICRSAVTGSTTSDGEVREFPPPAPCGFTSRFQGRKPKQTNSQGRKRKRTNSEVNSNPIIPMIKDLVETGMGYA